MCDTILISNSILSLSRRSFNRRLDFAVSDTTKTPKALSSLNRQLSRLLCLLRGQFSEIGESEYATLRPQIRVLLSTLHSLIDDIKTSDKITGTTDAISDLEELTSELDEIDSDILNFRIQLPKHPEYSAVISQISKLA